jgi:hypothetical protein
MANWQLAEILDQQENPLSATILSSGLSLDLDGPEEQLEAAFTELLLKEANMRKSGLSCDLKDNGQQCCTCQHAQLKPGEAKRRLCRAGRDLETIWSAGERKREKTSGELLDLVALAEEYSELEPNAEFTELLLSI